MELGQSTAFLGAFVASGVLAVVLAYIGKITGFRTALNLWSVGYALNALRLLIYSIAGIAPTDDLLFLLVEWSQVLQSFALLFGILYFVGKPPSLIKYVLPAAAGTLLLALFMTYAWGNGGPFRAAPFYGLTAVVLFVAGAEIVRDKGMRAQAGTLFTAAVLILWGLHKVTFAMLPAGFSGFAHIRFMLSAGLYTAAALGFSIVVLGAFHRRLSQATADNEAFFRKMFDDAPVGYQSLDGEGRIVAVNRQWLDLLGYTADEVIGRSFGDFLSPSSRPKFPARFAEFKKRGATSGVEFELIRKDGRQIIGAFEGRIATAIGSSALRTHCVMSDVTDRRHAEALISYFGRIIDQTFNEVFVLDAETLRIIHANKGALANTGYSVQELGGLTLLDLEPDFTTETFDALVAPLRAGEREMAVFETRFRRKDGATYEVEARVQLMADEIPPVFVATVQDISARKAAEAALKASEARLRAIVDHSPAAIVLRDREDRFVLANREYLRRTRKSEADVLGRTLAEVESEAVAREAAAQDAEVAASGRPQVFQVKRPYHDGGEAQIAVVRFAVPSADGAVLGTGAIGLDITEWKRAEEALRESEARLQAIMDHSPAAIFLKDRQGRFLVANREYLRRRNLKLEDILGKTTFDVNEGNLASEIWAQEQQAMISGEPALYQVMRQFAGGRETALAVMRFPVIAPSGEVVGVGGISIDVTREWLAESALRENEEKLRLVLQSTGEGIYATDLEGRCTLCNPAAARILGYDDPDELLSQDIHALIHHSRADGSAYPLAECRIHQAMSTRRVVHADDEVFWRRDGQPIPVEFRSNPVIRNDVIVGTVVSFADISERKKAEAWLLRLSQSVEQSPFGVIITDCEGRIEYANPSFLRESGYAAAEVKGKVASFSNAAGPGSPADREIWQAISAGREWRGEVLHSRKSGDVYWASLLVSPIRDAAGRTVAHVGISEDISERRRMADHLRQAQKMEAVGQLTGGIAHDFNNILSVILTSAECLADDLKDRPEQGALVAAIVRAVHRATGLTDRLLAFSRRQDLSPELLDLGTAVREVADLLRRSLGETITVSVESASGVPPVVVDRGQFENALLNLALNARDAMPQGGSLTVAIGRGDPPGSGEGRGRGGRGFVRVSVTDTGTGMPPEVAEHVFEPFFTTKGKGQGTGLGLSMVYGFVKQSGGDIMVDSVENRGTSFHLYFPAADGAVDARRGRGAEPGNEPGALPSLAIVLAEDDAGVRTATKFILENGGHRVMDAENGIDALEILKRESGVDLLLTDVIMPGGFGGRDLAEAAWAIKPDLKVLFTSGYADGRLSMGDIIPGKTAFVPKPYTKESLIGALGALWFS